MTSVFRGQTLNTALHGISLLEILFVIDYVHSTADTVL